MVALGRTNTIVALVPLSGPVPSLVPLGTRGEDTHAIRTFRRNSPPLPCKDQTCAGADSAPGTWPVNLSSGLNDLPATGVSRRAVPRERRPRTKSRAACFRNRTPSAEGPPDTPLPRLMVARVFGRAHFPFTETGAGYRARSYRKRCVAIRPLSSSRWETFSHVRL